MLKACLLCWHYARCLIFSSLSIDSFALLPITTFIVKIDCDLKWSLSYNGITVKNQQLSSFGDSQQIKCLNDVLILFKPAVSVVEIQLKNSNNY